MLFGFWEGFFLIYFAAFTNAQGQFGGSQASCNPATQAAVYIGCYDITSRVIAQAAGSYAYPFQISPYPNDYSSSTGNYQDLSSYVELGSPIGTVKAYADYNFTNGDGPFRNGIYYNSLTPANCTTACRGHGYAYSAPIPTGVCICSSFPPLGLAVLNTGYPYADGGPNNVAPDTYCHSTNGCPGDYNQNCGSNVTGLVGLTTSTYAPFYVDQSFPYFQQTALAEATGTNHYVYMGCFSLPTNDGLMGASQLAFQPPTVSTPWPYGARTVPGSQPATLSSPTVYTSILGCFTACAYFGFPFAGVVPGSGGSTGYSTYDI